jgi:hypothetical protein
MVRVLERALAHIDGLDPALTPLQRLQAVTRWTLQTQLAGAMPTLPSANSSLRAALMSHQGYLDRLMEVSDKLGSWIESAQADGSLDRGLPSVVVLYTLYARACDPVLGFLKSTGQFDDQQIIDMVLRTCFQGLSTR